MGYSFVCKGIQRLLSCSVPRLWIAIVSAFCVPVIKVPSEFEDRETMDRSFQAWKNRYKVDASAERPGHVRCSLCNTGAFHINGSNHHFQSWSHRDRLEAEFNRNNMTIVDGAVLLACVSKLAHESWKHDMRDKIMKYLFVSSKSTHRWPYTSHGWPYGENKIAFPTPIINSLAKYDRMEVTSLLELAVWKLNCLHLNGSGSFDTMQGILDQWALDESFSPVEYKRQRRFSSNVGIIMDRLLDFL